uniref:Uncharacterized protein n=1 Tax=Triticum urartu TaxID=4572 RepID=A0A8R7UZA8_TRIUA
QRSPPAGSTAGGAHRSGEDRQEKRGHYQHCWLLLHTLLVLQEERSNKSSTAAAQAQPCSAAETRKKRVNSENGGVNQVVNFMLRRS